ncbi:MAG: DedA family protein [Acidimicrobiales bacterium]|nr:DedA family protein [Acidimicrobiales bacterium]
MLTDLLASLETLSTNPWFYLAIAAMAAFDSVVPVLPGETTVILGGIAAGQGHLSLTLVVLAGALGAAMGDNLAFTLGQQSSGWLNRTLLKSDKNQQRLTWATDQLRTRGATLLLTARFVPGGRTAVTVSAGITEQPRARFVLFDGLACLLWALYAGVLGYVFGERFKDNHSKAFLLAFVAALSVTAVIEAGRWMRHRGQHEEQIL